MQPDATANLPNLTTVERKSEPLAVRLIFTSRMPPRPCYDRVDCPLAT
jgi:hypothetical protein